MVKCFECKADEPTACDFETVVWLSKKPPTKDIEPHHKERIDGEESACIMRAKSCRDCKGKKEADNGIEYKPLKFAFEFFQSILSNIVFAHSSKDKVYGKEALS